jgi:hypothetical protein
MQHDVVSGCCANCKHDARLLTDYSSADCRENGTRGRLGSVLVKFLEELLPDDIHERCRDKAHVAVTREDCLGLTAHRICSATACDCMCRLTVWRAARGEHGCAAGKGVFPRPTPELISDFHSKSDLVRWLYQCCPDANA